MLDCDTLHIQEAKPRFDMTHARCLQLALAEVEEGTVTQVPSITLHFSHSHTF